MGTAHNSAKHGDIAPTVIMAGDPLRVKFMAETYLKDPVLFNSVRNMFGYTGTHNGKSVSIMGHGMGIPSMAIYSYELFKFYGVEQIIRTGTAGCIQENMKIGDIVLAQGACTDSNFLHQYELSGSFAPIADFGLLSKAAENCSKLGYEYFVGNVVSSDIFYDERESWKQWKKMGVLALEMESCALYANAAKFGKKALTILTISDSLISHEETTPEERQCSFTRMMDLALSLI